MRAEMLEDVDRIVRILKGGTPDSGDQTRLLETVRKYGKLDGVERRAGAVRATPHLDQFLLYLKARAFSRSSITSLWQDQYSIVYDTLWYELRGYWLEEFKWVVSQSVKERTSGPKAKDVENGLALIAKQEAMGMWGMLKGMGTGLVGIAGPKASQAMAEQFDEAARVLFGHEWDSSEPLLLGMNAGQIGTVGGDVIWQLVTLARAAGPGKATKIMAIADKLKKVLGVSASLQGVALAAMEIARIIEEKQQRGEKITAELLIADPNFVDQMATLISSAIGAAMAAKGAPGSAGESFIRARIQALLHAPKILSLLNQLAAIAQSNKTAQEKEREYGQVMTSLIPELLALGLDARALAQARHAPEATAPGKQATGDAGVTEAPPARAGAPEPGKAAVPVAKKAPKKVVTKTKPARAGGAQSVSKSGVKPAAGETATGTEADASRKKTKRGGEQKSRQPGESEGARGGAKAKPNEPGEAETPVPARAPRRDELPGSQQRPSTITSPEGHPNVLLIGVTPSQFHMVLAELEASTPMGKEIAGRIKRGELHLTLDTEGFTPKMSGAAVPKEIHVQWGSSMHETASTLVHEAVHQADPALRSGGSRSELEATARVHEYEYRALRKLEPYDEPERVYREVLEDAERKGIAGSAALQQARKAMIDMMRVDPERYGIENPAGNKQNRPAKAPPKAKESRPAPDQAATRNSPPSGQIDIPHVNEFLLPSQPPAKKTIDRSRDRRRTGVAEAPRAPVKKTIGRKAKPDPEAAPKATVKMPSDGQSSGKATPKSKLSTVRQSKKGKTMESTKNRPGLGVDVPVTPKASKRLAKLGEAIEQSGRWSSLEHNDRFRLGRTLDKIVGRLVERLAGGRGTLIKYVEVTPSLIAKLRAKGGRVVIIEGKLGESGRFDFAEIDFGTGKCELLDLTSLGYQAHIEKTRGYKENLAKLTGMPVEAAEMRYVGANGEFLDDLVKVPLK